MTQVDDIGTWETVVPLSKMPELITMGGIRLSSLADQVYENLLTTLVFPDNTAEIAYGSKITESEIAKRLQISNGPVREALFRLRQEGWVKTYPNRGSYLVDFSDSEIAGEIYRFRLNMETGAFFTLARSITKSQLSQLRTILDELERAIEKSEIVEFRKADIDFHLKVVELSGGKSYQAVYRPKLLQWYAMAFHLLIQSMGSEQYRHCLEAPGTSSHRALFEAMVQHDGVKAAKLISGHFWHIAHMLGIDNNRQE